MAQEIGAQVLRGAVRYPGREAGFDVGDVDLKDLLYELRGQEVMIIIAPLGPAPEQATICGLGGTPYDGDECPTCKAEQEEAKRVIEERLRRDREEEE